MSSNDTKPGAIMFQDTTPAVARALEAARAWARSRGESEVTPVALLCGLLAEEEGRAAELFREAGLAGAQAIAVLEAGLDRSESLPESVEIHFSPHAREVLDHARDLAVEVLGVSGVASEAVVLALTRHRADFWQALAASGLSLDQLEAQLSVLSGPPLRLDEPLVLGDVTERVDATRILDANANRVREALRVVEDYCRFHLNDATLSGECKSLRHALAGYLSAIDPQDLVECRNTPGDVGTTLTTESEATRGSLQAVVRANLKRLQEALRSLEEFGKLLDPQLGAAIEQIRYRSYSLEQAILVGADARQRLAGVRLYVLLTGATCRASLDWTIEEACEGGAGMVQLREKQLDDRTLLERALRIRKVTRKVGALFILNDRPDIARLVGADGVHLGQEDLPVAEARRILGPGALIGVSTHTPEQVRQAVRDGASYLGVGPTFPSGTKDFDELAGTALIRAASKLTSLPTFAIGGIHEQNVGEAIAAGARRVAVSQAICRSDDPRAVATILRSALDATADQS